MFRRLPETKGDRQHRSPFLLNRPAPDGRQRQRLPDAPSPRQSRSRFFIGACVGLCALSHFTALRLARAQSSESVPYAWLDERPDDKHSLAARIPTPTGFTRVAEPRGSFGDWLRHLPLKPGRPAVHLFNGALKSNQDAHHAVVNIDVGQKDLQQCADALMRLRAEYLFAAGRAAEISFRFTDNSAAPFARWARGERPQIGARGTRWLKRASGDTSHASLRTYLDTVYTYAGTYSLNRESQTPAKLTDVRIGDFFIRGGFPGHAVLVVDLVENKGGEKKFLLVQSYMPAQEIHVLRNPTDTSPWYDVNFGRTLQTPEWNFDARELRRFR